MPSERLTIWMFHAGLNAVQGEFLGVFMVSESHPYTNPVIRLSDTKIIVPDPRCLIFSEMFVVLYNPRQWIATIDPLLVPWFDEHPEWPEKQISELKEELEKMRGSEPTHE